MQREGKIRHVGVSNHGIVQMEELKTIGATVVALVEIRRLARELNVSMIVLALSWVIARQGITSTIVGSRNVERLEPNMQGANFPSSPEIIAELNRITAPVWRKLGSNPDYYEHRNNSRIQ